MRIAPRCPRCRGPLREPGLLSSAWECVTHGEVDPLQPPRRPCRDALDAVRGTARVPMWVPWPLPVGWLVTGFADAGDERSGGRAVAVALSGPSPVGGPADLMLIAEQPGVGLGAGYAGLDGPDPGAGFGDTAPHAKLEINGHPVSLWAINGDPAVYVGEALGHWLWAVLWPASAGLFMLEQFALRDLREHDLDLPFGALCPRLG